ncbi:MAG: P63C domain-containing protein [Streptococcus sp.]|nr:P63C domain-containing protein [Streptococcus sp.]
MENKKINKVAFEGEIHLGGYTIPCYVLDNGTRVLSGRGMQNALKMVEESGSGTQTSGKRLNRYLDQKSLEPFIYKEKDRSMFEPLTCYKGQSKIHGYDAEILADVCEAFLDARNNIKLAPRQKIIAEQAEILMRGFARVGISALVDEATGYQYERERNELQNILNAYVSESVLKWQLIFTDDFYKELFRLWGIPFTAKYISRKPQFVGKLTNKYIYSQLPKNVVEAIKEKTKKEGSEGYVYRWHQALTPDVGKEHLKKQITEVTTLMSISNSREEFQKLFDKKYSNKEQMELELDFEDNKLKKVSENNENQLTLFDDF